MQFKKSLKSPSFIAGLAGVAFFATAIFSVIDGKPVLSAQNSSLGEQAVSGLPVRLKIPKISVDATITSVGIAPSGEMDVPKDPNEVAWFEPGTRPGEIGSAVVAGHFGWKNSIPAVFDNLNKLDKGDKILVEDDNGETVTFVVRETRIYGENDDASEVFDSRDGKTHLNLVTCGGVWDKTEKSYSERLVVFADKEI